MFRKIKFIQSENDFNVSNNFTILEKHIIDYLKGLYQKGIINPYAMNKDIFVKDENMINQIYDSFCNKKIKEIFTNYLFSIYRITEELEDQKEYFVFIFKTKDIDFYMFLKGVMYDFVGNYVNYSYEVVLDGIAHIQELIIIKNLYNLHHSVELKIKFDPIDYLKENNFVADIIVIGYKNENKNPKDSEVYDVFTIDLNNQYKTRQELFFNSLNKLFEEKDFNDVFYLNKTIIDYINKRIQKIKDKENKKGILSKLISLIVK
jgi:hypothetical protein